MKIVCITLDDETAEKLGEILASSQFNVNEQIASMIQIDYEEWQYSSHDSPRSARWIRFLKSEQN